MKVLPIFIVLLIFSVQNLHLR
jgi:hypothetical protein